MGNGKEGKATGNAVYFKGLEHYEAPEILEPWKEDEFPHRKSLLEIDRRGLLKMLGGAAVLAGLSGCRYQAARKIVPYVQQPEDAVAGTHRIYATSAVRCGFAIGLLADQFDGRPIRVDGHPDHPATLGSLDSRTTAEILNLYDPDRLKAPAFRGVPSTWSEALKSIREGLERSQTGAGVAILSENVCSPTLGRMADKFLAQYPGATWHVYNPVNGDNEREGSILAYGQNLHTLYDFTKADVLVSIDADAMHEGPMAVRYSRDISSRRIPGDKPMSRIYAFESHPSTLGVMADHRERVKPSEMLALVLTIAVRLGVPGANSASLPASVSQKVVDGLIKDLQASRGRSVFVCGEHLPAAVHAAIHAVNEFIGAMGSTVKTAPATSHFQVNHMQSLKSLVDSINSGKVQTLLILGGNPAYDAPADIEFGAALAKVPLSAHLSTHLTETGKASHWALPHSHFLESWGDGVSYDGTRSICQPLIAPMYDSRSPIELIDALTGGDQNGMARVQETHKGQNWNELLSKGAYGAESAPSLPVSVTPGLLSSLSAPQSNGLELVVKPDPMIYDGRFANNNWLHETPKPITNLTWDNALLVSKATADKLGVRAPYDKKSFVGTPYYGKADMVTVTVGDKSLDVPVWVNLGQADDVLVLHLGYGRTAGGEFAAQGSEAAGGGFNANLLRTSDAPTWVGNVKAVKSGKEYVLANTQHHNTIDATLVDSNRDILQEVSLADLSAEHDEHHDDHKKDYNEFGKGYDISLYPGLDYKDDPKDNYQWAMTIDLALCNGCNACVTACQAENNIPTVGKDQVQKGREMHWMRVDRYYQGSFNVGADKSGMKLDTDNPPIRVQPVTCMHCEQAPCEPVCPVAATTHSTEGLNQMVYNRCVGTRYCSNNCPYKVRRFNFFHYSQRADQIPVLKLIQNPEVTVRFRGVMEKCTYCVQRINKARITAKNEDREIKDGEVKTACQVACPSGAIQFGDMRKPENAVSKMRADKRQYLMLKDLNTRPRTTYLQRINNPSSEVGA